MSNTFSKPIPSTPHITTHTLHFQMPVQSVVSNEMDYDTFCDRFMARRNLPEMNETDEEFETRCEEAWTKVWNALKSRGYHEFPMGDCDEGEEALNEEMENFINDLIETKENETYEELLAKNKYETQMKTIKERMAKELPETKEDLKSNYEYCQTTLEYIRQAVMYRRWNKLPTKDLDEMRKEVENEKDRYMGCLWAMERGYQVGLVAKKGLDKKR